MQEGNGVAELFQITDNVGRDKNGVVFVPHKIQQQVDELIPDDRVQAAGGFVQKQQLRMVGQCHCKAEFHLHAGGVFVILFLSRQFKALAKSGIDPGVPIAVDACHHLSHLFGGQAGGDAIAAQHHTDVLLGAGGCFQVVFPQHPDGAGLRWKYSQNQLQGRALARTVLADEAADRAAGQGQIDRPQGEIRIRFLYAVQF